MRTIERVGSVMVGLAVLMAVGSGAASARTGSAGSWEEVRSWGHAPSARSAPSAAAVGRSIYVFGGVTDDFGTFTNTFHNDLYRFQPGLRRWTAVEHSGVAPAPRAFAGAVGHSLRGEFYVFGGASYDPTFFPFETYGDLWVYDTEHEAWDEVDAVNAGPRPRSGPTMWIDRQMIYVFGGITGTFEMLNDLWVYDIGANRWTELVADGAVGSPSGRHIGMGGQESSGILWNRRLVLYGGEGLDPMTGFTIPNDTWEYHIPSGTWSEVTPSDGNIAPERNYAASAIVDGSLYLHGGDVPGGSAGCGAPFAQNTTDEVWRFDIATSTWTQLLPGGDPVPALKRHAAAVVGDTMYLVGGYDFVCDRDGDPGQVWNTEVYAYEPE